MRKSAYNHFKCIFENSEEFIICIDDRQNIVFATNRVYPSFNIHDASVLHLSSVLSERSCNKVKAASNEPVHSVCFDFIHQSENAPKRCVVIPTLFEGIYYYILHISSTKLNAIDKLERQDIEKIIDVSALEIANSTMPIIEMAKALPKDIYNAVLLNIRRIRKVFGNIEFVATNHTSSSECKVIDLYKYINDLLERFKARLGEKRFRFVVLPTGRVFLTKISLEALDVMVTNLINEIVIRANGSAFVYVLVCADPSNNFIIVSDSQNGLGYHTSELIEQSDLDKAEIKNSRIIAARTVISRIVRDNGGKAFFTNTFGGGVTNGIMLKKSKARMSTLREDALESVERCDRLDTLLSDI